MEAVVPCQTDVGPVGVPTLGKCKTFTVGFYLHFCPNSRVCEPAYNSCPSPGSYKCEFPHTTSFPTMSISIDDLVSSLSSSHIGEEATDLAILQVRGVFTQRALINPFSCRHNSPKSYSNSLEQAQMLNKYLEGTPSDAVLQQGALHVAGDRIANTGSPPTEMILRTSKS